MTIWLCYAIISYIKTRESIIRGVKLKQIMQNEKITHITYKEMNPFTEEDFSKDMLLEIMEAPYYNKLNFITIETVYKKIHCKIKNNEY